MSKKIFVTRKIPDIGIKILQDKGYTVDAYPKDEILSQKKLISYLKKGSYDAVLCLLTDKINAAVFDSAPGIKLYVNYAIGFDNIDIADASKRGITVCNAPGLLSSEAVAQHTIALMLTLASRIVEADDFVRRGKYIGWMPMKFLGTSLRGKKLGIIGGGRIGSRVADHSKALGLSVIYSDIVRNKKLEHECGMSYCPTIEELLEQSDVVSLHVPLLESTKHLIDDSRLKMMKSTSFLINTSRGGVIDETALVTALENKIIAGAGLDVFEFEPKLSRGLTKLKNVVLTPHIASASTEARNEMAEIASANIIDFFEGRRPRNII